MKRMNCPIITHQHERKPAPLHGLPIIAVTTSYNSNGKQTLKTNKNLTKHETLTTYQTRTMIYDNEFDISSVESQKGVITLQRCSVGNQKGGIAVQSFGDSRPSGSQQTIVGQH